MDKTPHDILKSFEGGEFTVEVNLTEEELKAIGVDRTEYEFVRRALEKQVPRELKQWTPQCETTYFPLVVPFYQCPACEEPLFLGNSSRVKHRRINFCPRCGQKIVNPLKQEALGQQQGDADALICVRVRRDRDGGT